MQLAHAQGAGQKAPFFQVVSSTDGLVDPAEREDLSPALLAMLMTANRIMATEAVRTVLNGRISPPQFRTMNYLLLAPGASLSEVADHLGVRLPTASVLLTKLASEGYVLRSRHPHSRRRLQLALTDYGQAVTTSVRTALLSQFRIGLERLEEAERAALHDVVPTLRRIFALV